MGTSVVEKTVENYERALRQYGEHCDSLRLHHFPLVTETTTKFLALCKHENTARQTFSALVKGSTAVGVPVEVNSKMLQVLGALRALHFIFFPV